MSKVHIFGRSMDFRSARRVLLLCQLIMAVGWLGGGLAFYGPGLLVAVPFWVMTGLAFGASLHFLKRRPCGHGSLSKGQYFYWPFLIRRCAVCGDMLE